MKPIVEIAKAELKRLFYSPVSWLILVVFAFQMIMIFNNCMAYAMIMKSQKIPLLNLTHGFFAADSRMAFFWKLQSWLFLYFPLLTMNILSRDFNSGTIKLLYSSPISNWQIILGKYVSLLIFGGLLIGIIAALGVYGALQIGQADWPVLLSGITGLFLLICAYAAVGLFMSSLTSYAIVAAMTTFAVLGFFNYIGSYGQEIPFIRDVTYWFTISGRSDVFVNGLISTESLLYFIAFIGFFLSITWIRLGSKREKKTAVLVWAQYTLAMLIVALIGYFSSMPSNKIYWDVTHTKLNTLSKESQEVVKKLDGGLTIKTYVNVMDIGTITLGHPSMYKQDLARYDKYTRFKPEIRFEYIYYYKFVPHSFYQHNYPGLSPEQIVDSFLKTSGYSVDLVPYSAIQNQVDLSKEEFRFVSVVERENGRKGILRLTGDHFPNEAQITAVLKGLADEMPTIGFVTGHGEKSVREKNERGYKNIFDTRESPDALNNNGFELKEIDLSEPVPASISIMVLADVRTPFNEPEMKHFKEYLDRGGNMLIAAEPGRQSVMGPILDLAGVQLQTGTLVQPKGLLLPEDIFSHATPQAQTLNYWLEGFASPEYNVVMSGACGLSCNPQPGFAVTELLRTDSATVWSEMQTPAFGEDAAVFNPGSGEIKRSYITALALSRTINNKQQRILVTGDADWMSNGEFKRLGTFQFLNFRFVLSAFRHLSNDELPIDVRSKPPVDNSIKMERKTWRNISSMIKWGLPGILLLTGFWVLIRRKGR
jgi:ABC-2 type transport system permease protein